MYRYVRAIELSPTHSPCPSKSIEFALLIVSSWVSQVNCCWYGKREKNLHFVLGCLISPRLSSWSRIKEFFFQSYSRGCEDEVSANQSIFLDSLPTFYSYPFSVSLCYTHHTDVNKLKCFSTVLRNWRSNRMAGRCHDATEKISIQVKVHETHSKSFLRLTKPDLLCATWLHCCLVFLMRKPQKWRKVNVRYCQINFSFAYRIPSFIFSNSHSVNVSWVGLRPTCKSHESCRLNEHRICNYEVK